ncbi:MAG TPA: protein kinase [Candidatus Acidoferrum sp.]|jgi:serine/threonine protein kinase/Flp pilus assembly protein TadD|nr:protein kinase [Candidatus Acidoferrum sp.]
MLGQTISHYRITQKLGAGGMGVVYKALDLKLERTVALKFLPQDMVVTGADRERLLREARAASTLDHPNIGVIHGLEESDDRQFFIVMGYYEGMTLAEKLDRGLLPVREALDLAIQIARGLSAAHARNIVHRDIKPSNVIITPDNVAKIVDFGLARVVASASATQSMSLTGTLPYMAPEQILGEPVDQRSDVWALGVVLVQMLTGSHPFVRPNTAAMTFAILNQAPSALDAVPDAVQPLIYRTLSKKPEHRQANAAELLADLEEARAKITATPLVTEHPTLTRELSPRELKKMVQNASTPTWNEKPTPWLTRAALVAMILLIVFTGILLIPPVREEVMGMVYASTEKHIAVLPFDTPSNDPDLQIVGAGLMDAITNSLSNLDAAQKSLWIVPASEIRKYKIHDPESAFRDLGATMVVQGSVRRTGSDVHLTVVLIDAKRLRQIGSAQVEDPNGDLAAVQDAALVHLGRMMKVSVPEGIVQAKSTNAGAYRSYIEGLGFLQRYDKPGNVDRAIAALDSSVKGDPRFALGYATLCDAYRMKFQTENDPASFQRATENCEKAVSLDEKLPAVHVILGRLNTTSGKNDIALAEFKKALDINPKDAEAIMHMAGIYARMKHPQEAETYYKQAIALRPEYWSGYLALALFYDDEGRYHESIGQLKRVLELTPDNPTAYSNLGVVYMDIGDAKSQEAAEAAFRKSIELAPNYEAHSNLGYLYLMQKRYDDAAKQFREATKLNDKDWRVWANLMLSYQWLNDQANAGPARAKAQAALEQLLTVTPTDAHAHSELGLFYAQENLRDKALSHVHTALALDPKNGDVLGNAAETFETLGDRKQAIVYARASAASDTGLAGLQTQPGLRGVLADPNFRTSGKK